MSSPAGSTQHLLRKFEELYATLALFLGSGAVILGILRASDGGGDGIWINVLWLAMYGGAAVLLVFRRGQVRQAMRDLRRDPLLLILIAYAMASFLWAADPALTLRRVIAFGGTTLMGVYLAVRFSLREVATFLGRAMASAAILSLLTLIFVPEIGIYEDPRGDGIQGVFGNKNIFGRAMTLGGAVIVFLARDPWVEGQRTWWGALFIIGVLTLFSGSQTSVVTLVGIIALIPVFRFLRAQGKLLIPALIFAGLVVATALTLLVINAEYLLGLMGRDLTLSGRLPVWSTTVALILSRPWLGYGYGADWVGQAESVSFLFQQYFDRWQPTHAHNGLLQLGFELGAVGVGVFMLHLGLFIFRAVTWIRRYSTTYLSFVPMAFALALIGSNLTQTTILGRNNVYWIMYVCLALYMARPKAEPAHRAASQRRTVAAKG